MPEKEVNRKENTALGETARGDGFESLRMLRYRSWQSFMPLRNVLRQRRQGSFE